MTMLKVAKQVGIRKKVNGPFSGPTRVIKYLGRYSHKMAMSNHRIKKVIDTKVSFWL